MRYFTLCNLSFGQISKNANPGPCFLFNTNYFYTVIILKWQHKLILQLVFTLKTSI